MPSLLSMPCTLDALHMSFKRAEISTCTKYLPVGTWSSPHRDCNYNTPCRCWKKGGREEKQHSFICFTFSLLFYILQTDPSIFCVLPTTACSLLRNWGFLAQFCVSAFSLPVEAITLFNATTIAYPSFSSAHSVSSFYIPLLICLFLWTPTGVYSSLQACRKDKHSFSATLILSQHTVIKINSSTVCLAWERLTVC